MNAKNKRLGWRDGQVVRAWAALAQDPGSIPSTHGTSQGIYNSSFRGSTAASGPHVHQVHVCALTYMEANACEIKHNLLVLHRIYVAKFEMVKMAKNLKVQLDSYSLETDFFKT